jgi:hypothetical protein
VQGVSLLLSKRETQISFRLEGEMRKHYTYRRIGLGTVRVVC